jgi:hypothetical protein
VSVGDISLLGVLIFLSMLSAFFSGSKIDALNFLPKLFAYDTLRSSMIVERNERLLSDINICLEEGLEIEVADLNTESQKRINAHIKNNPIMLTLDTQNSNLFIIQTYLRHMNHELGLMDFILFKNTGVPCLLLINTQRVRQPLTPVPKFGDDMKTSDPKEILAAIKEQIHSFQRENLFSQSTETLIGSSKKAYFVKDKGMSAVIEANDSKWRLMTRLFVLDCIIEVVIFNTPFIREKLVVPFFQQFFQYIPSLLTNIFSLQFDSHQQNKVLN